MVGTDGDVPKVPSQRIVVKKIKIKKRKRTASTRKIIARAPINSSSAKSDKKSRPLPKPTRSEPTTASFGLPAFRFQPKHSKSVGSDSNRKNGNGSSVQDEEGDEEDMPSDTLMVIHSLFQSDQGLHIPMTNNTSVQVVLESQIYSMFEENHASTVNSELLELVQANKVRRMYCHDMSTMAFILTEDYMKAVWDSYSHNEKHQSDDEIVSWFLTQLDHWTNMSFSESFLEERWERHMNNAEDDCADAEPKDVVRYLLNAQFLLRDPKRNLSNAGSTGDSHFLWLPNWGIVLKTWNEARKQLLTLLAQRKEMSKANVLSKNRHSQISTHFLIHELLSKEKIRVVERPFGSFIQLVKGDS